MAIALGRRIGRRYVEFMALVYRAEVELNRCFPRAEELSRQAVDLAERHGWTDDLFAAFAAMTLGGALAWQGRVDDADAWVGRAERIFRREANPASAMGGQYVRGQLEMGRGRAADALAAFRAASAWQDCNRSRARCEPGWCTPSRSSARKTTPSTSWLASANWTEPRRDARRDRGAAARPGRPARRE